MQNIRIIYENRDIAVVEKPFGVLSQRDVKGESGLVELLADQLECEIYPVHRLDRPVGGVMVFAKNKTSAARLSGEGAFEKTYLAAVTGMPNDFSESGELFDYLYKDGAKGKSFVVKKERKGAKSARLAYEVVGHAETEQGRISLLKIRLFTGRTHQIRVQLSSRGMSIVGDGKYGSRIKCESIALWSYGLEIKGNNGRAQSFCAIPIKNPYFELFENEIKNI